MNWKARLSAAVLAIIMGGGGWAAISTQFLKETEGMRLEAYQDAGGIWTICYGKTGSGITKGLKVTQAQCEKWLEQDVAEAGRVVDRMVHVPMSDTRKAAVISFGVYNIGPGALGRSTFLRKLNAGDEEGVCAELRRWIFDGGRDCRDPKNRCLGQVKRRQMEEALCEM